jgi:microcystin degradation protein MlrC
MRIAIGGISTENCTFSPLLTRREDFTLHRGEAFLHRYPFLSKFDAEFVPLLWARALPGGSIEAALYQEIKAEFLQRLSDILPLDGVYLDMHGANNVQGMDDAEGDFIAAIRELVGKDCLISASYDLHGNVSQRVVENLDMMSAFRTAPHVDVVETREKALSLLVRCLSEGIRPARAWVQIPVVLPGEKTSTEWEPGLSVYRSLAESDSVEGVLDASLLVGYVWADEPRSSAATVVTGTDRNVIALEAARIGQRYWEARREFDFGARAGSLDECIEWALAAPECCVFISDSGDNPTAGGVGDVPIALERLLAHHVPSALVAGLVDREAVARCVEAGVGAEVALSLGGKLDPYTSKPFNVEAKVLHIEPSANTEVLIQVDNVKVILAERRRPYHLIADMQKMGIEPLQHKIVVIKIGYLEPDLKRNAPLALLALSPGAVDQAIERIPFQRINRPIYPLDKDMTWTPQPYIFP